MHHIANILPYLSAYQHDLTNKPQENIRKLVITILALGFGIENTGELLEILESSWKYERVDKPAYKYPYLGDRCC